MLSTLIVEDNATYRQSLHHLLEKRFPSMQIAEAADGEEAMRQALSRRFDFIFMDIRLPHGNGLSLTKAIKEVFAGSLICIVTNHAIFEYREAAFQNGADHFIVKGESTEAEIGDLVESWLRTRFISLIIVSDSLSRQQLAMLLSVHWPVMIVAEAVDAATGLGHTAALKPDLVLLELGLPDALDLVRDIRVRSPQATVIGMTDDSLPACRATAINCGVDHCAPLGPMGYTELVTYLDSIKRGRRLH